METHTIVLHTAEAVEDTLTALATMETLETWVRVWVIKMVEVQAAEAELEEIGNTAEQAAEAEQAVQQDQEEILLQVMVLDLQDTKVDLAGDQAHLAEHQDLITAGLHGLEWADLVAQDNTELQAEAAEAAELAEEDLVAEALEDLKQLITLEAEVEMEQDQAAAEIIINLELVKREVLA
jgi:hypothetical protein